MIISLCSQNNFAPAADKVVKGIYHQTLDHFAATPSNRTFDQLYYYNADRTLAMRMRYLVARL